MLMGEYEHSVDAKGRLFVPAKLRSELGKTFVITKGVDGCIDVYPMDAWDRLQQSFAQQTLPKKKPVMFPASFWQFHGSGTG